MPVSRNSFRRVLGDLVHRHHGKHDSIASTSVDSSHRLLNKSDRNSIVSSESISFPETQYDRLQQSGKEVCKSLNYLEQVLTHHKLEILASIITSLIENIFDIDSILKGIFEHQSESFRNYLLTHVYSLLADLVDWSDQLLFLNNNIQASDNDKHRNIAKELMQAVQMCISLVCDVSSLPNDQTRSNSYLSYQSINNDELAPVLPPKREKRTFNPLTKSRSESIRHIPIELEIPTNRMTQDEDNDKQIQSIVDDINHIIEDYTRELDDALRATKTKAQSSSIDQRNQPYHLPIISSNVPSFTKSSTIRTHLSNGELKSSCQTSKPSNGQNETGRFNEIYSSTVPPLPPKCEKARAYMSLFNRYDQNEAQLFLRDTCLVPSSQRRFEDLFEPIQQHFNQMSFLFNSDDSLRMRSTTIRTNSSINGSLKDDQGYGRIGAPDHFSRDSIDSETAIDFRSDLFLENISHLLVFNLNEDPSLRGGTLDALIIRATSPDKKDFLYQEAFLTTYRTFILPIDLVRKLIQRYTFFAQYETKKKIARYAFSLVIRVIDEIDHELTEDLMKILSNFVTNLIRHGELQLSKLLRRKSLERFKKFHDNTEQSHQDILLIRNSISSKRATLLDFHSSDISEQLTLLDSELFLRIQLSEILYMSIEKGEEFSPNLAAFTEHFNNISYWVRSRILEQNSQRQRENYFEKFLKILKHLRRLNNFNSYLAILSALDCGPLKRLDWSKTIIDSVSEHTDLIDSTGSFKNYREALNNSVGQPCIPYIGLILSDLTFIHIGNSDYLQDLRIVNFWKRWQQFTILHKLRYCRKWEYKFVRNDRIMYFFNNFDDYMNEDAQWIQSEKIKPRQKSNIQT